MAMKLPSRPETHVTEAASWRLLQNLAPDTWIVREVTERDYGIDAYVEIASTAGEITGDLISVQLKGTAAITWKKPKAVKGASGKRASDTATSPQIATSTANYWERLPVPVFLFVADIAAADIYYVSVEQAIRRNYGKLSNQDSMTFRLMKDFSLGSDLGAPVVEWLARRERLHRDFVFHIAGLVSHAEGFHEFIGMNQGRDSFMEVEADAHLRFRALYQACRMAAEYLGTDWTVDELAALYKRDREQFQDDHCMLHEATLDLALVQIEAIFPTLLRGAVELIGNTEGEYWRTHHPVLHSLCNQNALGWLISRMEEEAQSC